MLKFFLIAVFSLTCSSIIYGQQTSYSDSILVFRNKYVNEHEVVKGEGKKQLDFYPIDTSYCITARFEKAKNEPWFSIQTSGKSMKDFRVYGMLYFSLHDSLFTLMVLQSKSLLTVPGYKDYLLIAFTDLTSGAETYENGRYIDALTGEMDNGVYILDFNKAYNPYCAYVSNVYNCPVPPPENNITAAIRAGEKKYRKQH